ncbi:MAG: sulfur carrier protein [Granulosicoccus sp.]
MILNGESLETECKTLQTLLEELGHSEKSVATAANKVFVPKSSRSRYQLESDDLIEIIAPMSGG